MSLSTEPVPLNLPSPPFVTVEGLPNLRDLGGYPVANDPSKSVKRGIVYRGAAPSNKITEDGFTTIAGLGLSHVYDVRSETEIEKTEKAGKGGVIEFEGVKRVFAPVFRKEDYSPQNLAVRFSHYQSGTPEGFSKAYYDILSNAKDSYSTILRHLAQPSPTPLMLHCTAGKDRTGVLCALILSLCGCSDVTTAREYELTEQGLAHWREGAAEALKKSHRLDFNHETALNMLSARFESMLATLEMIREKFGGTEKYLIDVVGLTEKEIKQIRDNLVVDEPAIHEMEK